MTEDGHDHGGGSLGTTEPVDRIDVHELDAGFVSVEGRNQVDVVSEPAIDHEGDLASKILSFLEDRTVDHLFVLPRGSYTWNTELVVREFDFFGVVGAPAATLEITSHDPDYAFHLGPQTKDGEDGLLDDGVGKRALLENVTVDITASETHDAGVVRAALTEGGRIENLALRGRRNFNQPNGGGKFSCRVDTVGSEGVTTIRDVILADGEVEDPDVFGHAIPFSADPAHRGTNVWEGCWAEGFATAAFYMMNSPKGINILRGCTAKDNGGHNIRLGEGDVCRDSRVVLSDASDPDRHTPGVALQFYGGAPLAENVSIDAPDAGNRVVSVAGYAEGGTVRDVDVHVGAASDVTSIHVHRCVDLEEPLVFENVSVVDENDGSGDVEHSVYVKTGGVSFRDCSFEIPERSGVAVRGDAPIDDVSFAHCTFDVGGEAVRFFEPGTGHGAIDNRFDGAVRWDEPLSAVLWLGNRHEGDVDSAGTENWNALANWGFDLD